MGERTGPGHKAHQAQGSPYHTLAGQITEQGGGGGYEKYGEPQVLLGSKCQGAL